MRLVEQTNVATVGESKLQSEGRTGGNLVILVEKTIIRRFLDFPNSSALSTVQAKANARCFVRELFH
jgi:hypothetical protein